MAVILFPGIAKTLLMCSWQREPVPIKPKRNLPSSLPAGFFFACVSGMAFTAAALPAMAKLAAPSPAADTFFKNERRVFSIFFLFYSLDNLFELQK